MYELIGSGSITSSAVLKKIFPELKFTYKKTNKFNKNQPIKLKGLTQGMGYHLAGCCAPIQGDKIVGIVTAGLGVSIHTVDCNTLDSILIVQKDGLIYLGKVITKMTRLILQN